MRVCRGTLDGGAEGIRTPDPHNAIVVLYQLSYDPNQNGCNLGSQPCLSNLLPAGRAPLSQGRHYSSPNILLPSAVIID